MFLIKKHGLNNILKRTQNYKKKPNNDFARDLLKMLNNTVFGKSMQNVRKHRDIKLVTSNKKRCKLASKPNYHTTKWFSENVLAIEMKKNKSKHEQGNISPLLNIRNQ